MIDCVLLEGYLSDKVLKKALREIRDIAKESGACTLVVDSPGGELLAALKFVKDAGALPLIYGVKIYSAQSVATFIAFSLQSWGEMRRDAVLGFHRGRLTVEVPDLSKDGQVPKEKIQILREYGSRVDELIGKQLGITDPKLLGTFHGSGWLRLTAEECLDRKLVQRLF